MKKPGFIMKLLARRRYMYIFIFAALFSGLGAIAMLQSGFAISTPVGYADYCYLESGSTVIYGWAHDDDAPPGGAPQVTVRLSTGQAVTVPTDRAGYREAEIDQDLAANGWVPSDIYGFRAVFSGVQKGSSPTISGTMLNYGPGTDSPLSINNFRTVNGPNYFIGNKVPDDCLAPVPSTPVKPTPRPPTPARPKPPAPPALSINADATVTAGSVVASLQIPNGNAEKVRIPYGETEQTLDQTSEEIAISPDATTVVLKNLKLNTTYYYQIIRMKNDGTSVNSPTASFKTQALDAVLYFLNGEETVPGIEATIASLGVTGKSDENGIMTLKQLPEGSHSLTFTHEGKEYQREIEVSLESAQPEVLENAVVGTVAVNVQLVEQAASPISEPTTDKKGSSWWIILLILLLLGLIGGGLFWFIRKRRTADVYDDSYLPSSLPPSTLPSTQFPPPNPTSPAHHTPQAGESLKDLVINSMREEAARKQAAENTKNPSPPDPR